MRKLKLLALLACLWNVGYSQKGELKPDLTKQRLDTVQCTFVHLDNLAIKTDTGFIVRVLAPMVFVGENNTLVPVGQISTISTKYYTMPNKAALIQDNIIFIKIKN